MPTEDFEMRVLERILDNVNIVSGYSVLMSVGVVFSRNYCAVTGAGCGLN